jgi:hypothetical protein
MSAILAGFSMGCSDSDVDSRGFGALPTTRSCNASRTSFLRGASHADDIGARAALGYSAIAITDECSLAGVVRAHVEAKKAGIPYVVGSGFTLTNADGTPALCFTALAMNRNGYGNLSELITMARMRADKGSQAGRARPRSPRPCAGASQSPARLHRNSQPGLSGR